MVSLYAKLSSMLVHQLGLNPLVAQDITEYQIFLVA